MSDGGWSVGSRSRNRLPRLGLVVGFVAFSVALLAASNDPATGYELSIYAGTTPTYWVAVAVATACAVVVAFSGASWTRGLAVVLGIGAVFSVVALPFLRGYHFYGTADPMTHLGWARSMAAGELQPSGLLYPGIHVVSVGLSYVAGWPVRTAMLLVTELFALVFVVCVPLVVRELGYGRTYVVAIGGFSALLLLPINHISMFLRTHTFSQTTLYTGLVMLALVMYAVRVERSGLRSLLTAEGTVLSVAAVASILYHPQTAADLLFWFATISGVQFVLRLRSSEPAGDRLAPLYGPTAVFGVAYAAWALPAEWFQFAVEKLARRLVLIAQGRPPVIGERIASQSASLLAIGSGPLEVFLKMFVPMTVYLLLAGVFVLALLRADPGERWRGRTGASAYLALGAVVAGGFIVIYFVSSIAEMYFRHLGLTMVFATVLGALTLVHAFDTAAGSWSGRVPASVRAIVVVAFLVMLPLTASVAYQSPHVHKANQHVTERQMDGWDWTFDATDGTSVVSPRDEARRFKDATRGPRAVDPVDVELEGEEVSDLRTTLEDGGYIVLTDRSVNREVVAYQELRFTRGQFESLHGQPGVDRVMSNGDLRVYHVRADDE